MLTSRGAAAQCEHKSGNAAARGRILAKIPRTLACPRCLMVSSLLLVTNGGARAFNSVIFARPAFVHGPMGLGRAGLFSSTRGEAFGFSGWAKAARWMSAPPSAGGGKKTKSVLETLTKLKALKRPTEDKDPQHARSVGKWEDFDEEDRFVTDMEMLVTDQLSRGGKIDPNDELNQLWQSDGPGNVDPKLLVDEEDDYKFEGTKRCGTVAIVGAPNAGKSTLLNKLIGSKIAIVTHKKQTTRNIVTGIAMEEGTQIIYIDTPGIMDARPGERLNKAMVKGAWNAARDADEVFFLVDANKVLPGYDRPGSRPNRPDDQPLPTPEPEALRLREKSNEELILKRLCQRRQPFNLILNKVDQLKGGRKDWVLLLADEIKRQAARPEEAGGGSWIKKVYAVSAMSGKGLIAIRDMLREGLPEGPWLYPPDQISDIPMRNIVAEMTRESILLRAHEEVPYASYVETVAFEEKPDGSVRIEQVIYCETDGQKRILVGMVKDLGMRSRREISKFMEKPVHLFLTVKVKKWLDTNANMYEKLGLDFNA